MKVEIEDRRIVLGVILILAVAGVVIAVTQTDLLSDEDEPDISSGEAMRAQNDAMRRQDPVKDQETNSTPTEPVNGSGEG